MERRISIRLPAFAKPAALEGRAPASPARATGVAELRPPMLPNDKWASLQIPREQATFHRPSKTNLHAFEISSFLRHSSFVLRHFRHAPRIRETWGRESTRARISAGSLFLICSTEMAFATSKRPDFTRRKE